MKHQILIYRLKLKVLIISLLTVTVWSQFVDIFSNILPLLEDLEDSPVNEGDRTGRILTGSQRRQAAQLTELRTTQGIITGTAEPSAPSGGSIGNSRAFYAFRGIPYAKPPVGNLRWADPEFLEGPWPGGRIDATQYRAFCPQYDHDRKSVVGNEDCLFLNVFTPIVTSTPSASLRLPVLVFIHGGAYSRGASSSHGPERLMRENIVVVTFNYRLGILGLLSTNDRELPGNYAALDQIAVLRWVRSHISDFGGDPESVTLAGFSAGASYVHLHLLSPLSQGLFHKAIMISGAGNCLWSVQHEPEFIADQLADDLNCPYNSFDFKQCLRLKDADTLIKTQAKRSRFVYWPFEFRPVVDQDNRDRPFLPAKVRYLMEERRSATVPVLVGGVPEEGLLYALTVLLFSDQTSNPKQVYDEASTYIFQSLWPNISSAEHVTENLKSFYFSESAQTDTNTLVSEMTDALTDLLFTSCIWDAAQNLATSQNLVYTYLMTHHDETSPSFAAPLYRLARSNGITSPLLQFGVSHGDDVILMFSFPFALGIMSSRDAEMSNILTSMVGAFVSTGSPQTGLSNQFPSWAPLQPGESTHYYRLSLNPIMIQKPYKYKERNMWQQVIQRMEEDVNIFEAGWRWQIGFWVLITVLLVILIVGITLAVTLVYNKRKKKYPKTGATLRSQRTRPQSVNVST